MGELINFYAIQPSQPQNPYQTNQYRQPRILVESQGNHWLVQKLRKPQHSNRAAKTGRKAPDEAATGPR